MWLSIIAFVAAFFAVFLGLYNYGELRRKLESSDIADQLERSSKEHISTLARQLKAIETEWDDMYQKFSRLAGRMDRRKQLSDPPIPENPSPAPTSSRSDLLRRRKLI